MGRDVGKLVWEVNGRVIVIVPSAPFPMLNAKRKELLKNPDYRKGKLSIKYLFK